MPGRTRIVAAVCLSALGLAACGAEKSPDIKASSGSYDVQITHASFPDRQHVASAADLVLTVRNAGDKAIPDVVVTVWTGAGGAASEKASDAFAANTVNTQPGTSSRAIWVQTAGYPKVVAPGASLTNLDAAPAGGNTVAQTDTFAFGALARGASRTAVWRVIPVHAGSYVVHYALAASLNGNAKLVSAGGGTAGGSFTVNITDAPSGTCVVKTVGCS